MVPESANYFLHTLEGSDDLTSHIKVVSWEAVSILPFKMVDYCWELGKAFIFVNT